jgi:hypothetical protein
MNANEENTTSDSTPKPKKKHRKPPFNLNQEQWKLAKRIMTELGEPAQSARHQIARIVRYCGIEFAEQLFQDTMEIEANGGMLTADGSRRRTPGGVFFSLGRSRMTDEQRKKVFNPPRKKPQPKPDVDSQATAEAETPKPEPPTQKPDLPPEVEAKFNELQLAAEQFRRKIAAIEAEPEDKQFMLALTRKMLRNTEGQIEALVEQYQSNP